jgi:hypothetical protein
MLLSYTVKTILVLSRVSWYQNLATSRGEFLSDFMTDGRGRRGQVPSKEVPYHECSVQVVIIENLQS